MSWLFINGFFWIDILVLGIRPNAYNSTVSGLNFKSLWTVSIKDWTVCHSIPIIISTTTFLNPIFWRVFIALIDIFFVFFLLHNAISLSSNDCIHKLTLLIPTVLYARNLSYSTFSGDHSKLISCAVSRSLGFIFWIFVIILSIVSGENSVGVHHQKCKVLIVFLLIICLYISISFRIQSIYFFLITGLLSIILTYPQYEHMWLQNGKWT